MCEQEESNLVNTKFNLKQFLDEVNFTQLDLKKSDLQIFASNFYKFLPSGYSSIIEMYEQLIKKDPKNLNGLFNTIPKDDPSYNLSFTKNYLEEVLVAINSFTGSSYSTMNNFLREMGDIHKNINHIESLDYIFKYAKAIITTTAVISYGLPQVPISQNRVIDNDFKYSGNLHNIEHDYVVRYERNYPERIEKLIKFCENNEITSELTLLSTSIDKAKFKEWYI